MIRLFLRIARFVTALLLVALAMLAVVLGGCVTPEDMPIRLQFTLNGSYGSPLGAPPTGSVTVPESIVNGHTLQASTTIPSTEHP